MRFILLSTVPVLLLAACGSGGEGDVGNTNQGGSNTGGSSAGGPPGGAAGASAGSGTAGTGSGGSSSGGGGSSLICSVGDYKLCQGGCPVNMCDTLCATTYSNTGDATTYDVGVCILDGGLVNPQGPNCTGNKVVVLISSGYYCVDPALCDALLHDGIPACTYQDFSAYTKEAVPEPTSCPNDTGNATFCGGSCGDCPSGEVCTGRSPTHPVGFCVDPKLTNGCGSGCMDGGFHCLVEQVLPLSVMQGWKPTSRCLPQEKCVDVANNLPGGAVCVDKKGAVVGGAWPTE